MLKNANINVISVAADNAIVKVTENSTIQVTQIQEAATKATFDVAKEAIVKKLDSSAKDVIISGEGKVVEAVVSGNNTKVNTENTTLTVEKGTSGVVENGNPVKDTGIAITTDTTTPTQEPTNQPTQEPTQAPPSDGGSTTPSNPTSDTVGVTNENELIDAMNSDSVNNIIINDNIQLIKNLTITKYVEIVAGKELTVAGGKNLTLDTQQQIGQEGDQNYVKGYKGELNILGTLNIPNGSTFYNYTNTYVGSNGKLKNGRNYVDISGSQEESTKFGLLQTEDNSSLYNEGTFVISSRC